MTPAEGFDPDEMIVEDMYYCIVPNDPDGGVISSFETRGKAKRAAVKLGMPDGSFTIRTCVASLWCMGLTREDV